VERGEDRHVFRGQIGVEVDPVEVDEVRLLALDDRA
jgi:hypothetical protein